MSSREPASKQKGATVGAKPSRPLNELGAKGKFFSRSFLSLNGLDKQATVEQRITDALLTNNANLLALICQASFVGDTAATVSVGVLSLLRRQKSKSPEEFLKRLLKNRIETYIKKSRDLSDIIRDNSMATMLLNAFARSEGITFLSLSVSEAMKDILPYIDQCEIDPVKGGTDPAVLAENEVRLKTACYRIISGIYDKRESMPATIRRMCTFLRNTIDEIMKDLPPPVPLKNNLSVTDFPSLTTPGASHIQLPTIPSTGRLSIGSLSPTSASGAAQPEPQNLNRPRQNTDPSQRPISVPSPDPSGRNRRSIPDSNNGGTVPTLQRTLNNGGAPELGKLPPLPTKISETAISSSVGASTSNGSLKKGSLLEGESAPEPPPKEIRLSRVAHNKDESNGKFSVVSFSSPRSMGSLAVAEKVVGSFLFLRFFVPAITSPDSYGLLETKVTPSARRGLVLCGKILTALCNDVEFGGKEQYLMALNPFLREHKDKIKEFLGFASSSETTSENSTPPPVASPLGSSDRLERVPTNPGQSGMSLQHRPSVGSTTSSSNNSSRQQSKTSKFLTIPARVFQGMSSSLPSLVPKETSSASNTTGRKHGRHSSSGPRTRSTEFPEVDHFFFFLGKSLPKIERDVEDMIAGLSAEDSEGVLPNYYELKRLIENSQYNEGGDAPRKSTPLWERFKTFRFKGLFAGKVKSNSCDDLNALDASPADRKRGGSTTRSVPANSSAGLQPSSSTVSSANFDKKHKSWF